MYFSILKTVYIIQQSARYLFSSKLFEVRGVKHIPGTVNASNGSGAWKGVWSRILLIIRVILIHGQQI